MNITNHAKERYVERIQGINGTNNIKQYIAQNEQIIEERINKLFEYAELIFTGQVGGDKTAKNFYLNDDICLVIDGDCIRTIYKINFAFPEKTRLMVIEDLKNEIQRLQKELYVEETILADKDIEIDTKISELQSEINGLYEEINIRKTDIDMYQATKKANRGEIRRINRHLQHYAEQLLGNTEYKKDVC